MRKLLLCGLVLGMLLGVAPALAAEPVPQAELVWISFVSQDDLAALAARLDIWEVDHEGHRLLAYVSPADLAWLVDQDFPYQAAQPDAPPETIPGYPCYRTIDEQYAQLDQWAGQYPAITRLSSIGISYEGRELKLLRLTNEATGTDKPVFFLLANIHGRELITNEAALVFIERILDNYGSDPDVTWLLDHHIIYVLASANPDGHAKNETGQPWAYWRKNTHPYGSCSSSDYGVDLNRNFIFKWGGAGTNPCSETYQGPFAGSESETNAVQNFVRSIFPDQRGPGDNDPAPDDATGLLITLHSYSNLILWPWGHTSVSSPNGAQLQMIGRKLATYNNYTPQQANQLYPTTGTTDDWSYGELGVASFTYEIGTSGDGFYPSCSRYDALVNPNVESFFYAAKIARTPYITAFGPDARDVTVTPDAALVGQTVEVRATIDDGDNGNRNVAEAEVYVGVSPWDGGTPYPLQATDGAFDEPEEAVQAAVPTAGGSSGRQLVFVRGRDADGYWGPVSAAFVELRDDSGVHGTVKDAASGAPLEAVAITVDGDTAVYTTATSASGTYFVPLPSGTYTVTASHFDYQAQSAVIAAQTGVTATQNFALARLPWGTLAAAVYELGTALPLDAEITVDGTPLVLAAQPTATLEMPVGTYTLTASAPRHAPRQQVMTLDEGAWLTRTFRLPPPPPLLLVDDDAGEAYEAYFLPALDALGLPYDTWSVAERGEVSGDTLSAYEAVVWFTGDDRKHSLNVSEQAALDAYLDGGGRLFLTGQNIGADIQADPGHFYRDRLRAVFQADDAGDALTVAGGDFYAGISASLWGAGGANNQSSPDVIAPHDASATPVFTYSVGGTAGLAVDPGPYRVIYLSYGLEAVPSSALRESILREALAWLGVAQPPARFALDLKMPHPVLHRNMAAPYTLALFNDSLLPVADGSVTVTLSAPVSITAHSPGAEVLPGNVLRWSALAMPSEAQEVFTWTVWLPGTASPESVVTCTVEAGWAKMDAPAVRQMQAPVRALYAVGVTPAFQTLAGRPGEDVAHHLTVANAGDTPSTFTLALSASHWPTLVEPLSLTLGVGDSAPVTVTVTVPPEADSLLLYAPDVVTLTVTSEDDPGAVAKAVLRTTALTGSLFLPVVLRGH